MGIPIVSLTDEQIALKRAELADKRLAEFVAMTHDLVKSFRKIDHSIYPKLDKIESEIWAYQNEKAQRKANR